MLSEELDDQIAVLSRAPETIAGLIISLSAADLQRPQADGTFSITETLCHLRDLEAEAYAIRISRILDEANPVLPDFDGSRVAIERNYNSQDARQALRQFAETRRANVEGLRSVTP